MSLQFEFVAITPNGAFSYVSPCYGGRASDIFLVRNIGFLNKKESNFI